MELTEPQQIGIWDRRMAEIALRDVEPDPNLVRIVEGLNIRLKQALDLGCGAGRHLCWLAENHYVATGLDWSQEAVEAARRALRARELKATVVRGDAKSLKFPENSFPLIISTAVLHHNTLKNFKRALIEVKRVLKIGGYAVISLPSRNDDGAKRPGSWVEEGTLAPSEGAETGIPHHYFTEDEIRSVTTQFREVHIERAVRDKGASGPAEQSGTDQDGGRDQPDFTPWDGSINVKLPEPKPRRDPLAPPEYRDPLAPPPAPEPPQAEEGGYHEDWLWVVLKG